MELLCFFVAVNLIFYTTTNNMNLSTPHLWHSLHITSPQYVDKVRNFYFLFNVLVTILCIHSNVIIYYCHSVKYVASKYIFCSVSPVPRNQLLSVAAACKVLIEFSLLRLENPDEACAVSQVRETSYRGICNVVGLNITEQLMSALRRHISHSLS